MARVSYDSDTDSGYIYVSQAHIEATEPSGANVIVDRDRSSEVVGVEVLSVSNAESWLGEVIDLVGLTAALSLLELATSNAADASEARGSNDAKFEWDENDAKVA